ncbi:MAG: caspase family protein [Treponema sp.]|jgi:hypothetical protein|nr:caspase family protein [Treponema sp.]
MKKIAFFLVVLMAGSALWAQQKYALVIGNGAYANIAQLSNPVNDADDMTKALQDLGFTVEKVLDGTLDQIENAVIRLKNRLSMDNDSYGFLFYAGHGVQSNGENYLIPVDANIQSESFIRQRAVSVQAVLDELNTAGNVLNIVVLDACRDNPFGWNRSGSRGLSLVGNQPADSIIVFATTAGSVASDGTGRNGLFTEHLLNNISTPGLDVGEIFRLTMGDVARASNNMQRPAVYNQFPGIAYLGNRPAVYDQGFIDVAVGSLIISTITGGTLEISGGPINQITELPAWGTLPIERINAGSYQVLMRYEDGRVDERTITIGRYESIRVEFTYQPGAAPAPRTSGGIGQTLGYGAMNIAFGLGSYLQKDTIGGIIVTSGYVLSAGLIIWEFVGLTYDHPMAGIPGTVGLGLAGATLVFGFIKPFLFNRSSRAAPAMDGVNIVPLLNERGASGLGISYRWSF